MSILPLLLFVLPLGLDTLGVSISLGIKSQRNEVVSQHERSWRFPTWLQSAILFSLAETLMPLAGLGIGYASSLLISDIIRFLCPLPFINVCLLGPFEGRREYIREEKAPKYHTYPYQTTLKRQ